MGYIQEISPAWSDIIPCQQKEIMLASQKALQARGLRSTGACVVDVCVGPGGRFSTVAPAQHTLTTVRGDCYAHKYRQKTSIDVLFRQYIY